jgi:hypothetical protein
MAINIYAERVSPAPRMRASEGAVQNDFSSPPVMQGFSGFLFDMDGTIIDSTNAIVKHWEE